MTTFEIYVSVLLTLLFLWVMFRDKELIRQWMSGWSIQWKPSTEPPPERHVSFGDDDEWI